jgi:hypothetical protein
MSNLNAIGLIAAIFVSGGFLVVHVVKAQNDAAYEIRTGVIRGVPVSTRERWIVLYQTWFGRVTLVLGFDFFLTITLMTIAADVGDSGAKAVAYIAAGMAGIHFVGHLLFSVSAFIGYSSMLRQAERD